MGGTEQIPFSWLTRSFRLISSVPLDEVSSIEVKRLLVGKTVRIAVSGSEVKPEVPPGNDPKGFAAEFERVKSAA